MSRAVCQSLRDLGHSSIEFTIHDSKVYAKAWSVREELHLTPDPLRLEFRQLALGTDREGMMAPLTRL